MDYLSELDQQSIYIMREAYARERNCALLWSMGKDSTNMVWIARKAFLGKIPFPVIHIDTARKFGEIYFQRIAIDSRKNQTLQQQYVPLRYRPFMVEFTPDKI